MLLKLHISKKNSVHMISVAMVLSESTVSHKERKQLFYLFPSEALFIWEWIIYTGTGQNNYYYYLLL